jgi:capsular polysaccharide biosynthesis protein
MPGFFRRTLSSSELHGFDTEYAEARVRPNRTARIATKLQSEQALRLRTLFTQDEYSAAAMRLIEAKDCVIDELSGAIVFEDGSLEPNSAHVAKYFRNVDDTPSMRALYASARRCKANAVFHAFHGSCGPYGHFVLDVLCTIGLFRDFIRKNRLKILMPSRSPPWAAQILKSIGFGRSWIIPADLPVFCRRVYLSNTLSGTNCFYPHPVAIDKLRDMVRVTAAVRADRRIYLVRENVISPRHVLNEADVMDIFKAADFELINPSRLSFREQAALFASAKIIAGSHGSAFANLLFVGPGAHIIDLMPESWVGYWGATGHSERWLLNLSGVCEADYSVLLSRSTVDDRVAARHSNHGLAPIYSTVDTDTLRTVLSEIL